ncbi:hypothetical protein CR513_05874, partial [Mucuna pruriens]
MNVVVDSLLRRHALIVMHDTKLNYIKKNIDFNEPFSMCAHLAIGDFYRHDNFIFKGKRLCVLMSSIRQLLMKEAYEGGLVDHFGELKTFEILNEYFFWPHMRKDVHNICERCLTCKLANSKVSLHGLYTTFLIPTTPWINISMDFVLGLPRLKGGRNYFFLFLWWINFPKWPISFYVIKVIMLLMWPIFSLGR